MMTFNIPNGSVTHLCFFSFLLTSLSILNFIIFHWNSVKSIRQNYKAWRKWLQIIQTNKRIAGHQPQNFNESFVPNGNDNKRNFFFGEGDQRIKFFLYAMTNNDRWTNETYSTMSTTTTRKNEWHKQFVQCINSNWPINLLFMTTALEQKVNHVWMVHKQNTN